MRRTLHIQLAKVLACLGEKDAALSEAQRATELRPESKDAFGGPEISEGVAEVHAILGDNDRAIEILDGLLSRPSDCHSAGSESKSDLGSAAKRSAISGFAEQIRCQNLRPRFFSSPLRSRRMLTGRFAPRIRSRDAPALCIGRLVWKILRRMRVQRLISHCFRQSRALCG